MAKQYKVKDINNNGKIDGWEQGKYDAINNSATKMYKKEKSPMKMGYAMKMVSKQIDSLSSFNTKDSDNISNAPAFSNLSEISMVGDTLFPIKSISTPNMSGLSAPKSVDKKYVKAGKKSAKLAKKLEAKKMQAQTERQLGNYELGKQRSNRAARIQKRIDRRAKRFSKK